MPVDDYGVKAGLQALHKLDTFPKKQDFARLTERWQPYRSIGAWYLWRVADGLKIKK
jgi:DNA-3-methyladenine glycosylase II